MSLLRPCPSGLLPGSIDAVLVPTHRPVAYLEVAIELARDLKCPIVALCSGKSKAIVVSRLLAGIAGVAGFAVTVASTPRSSLLDLHTHRFASPMAEPYLDTGNKRNVALLLGRLLGWQRVLFLDDDIRGLTSDDVQNAAAGLAPRGFQLVGWPCQESADDWTTSHLVSADNSVVCHAVRSSGSAQEVFIGSGALLVELSGWLPFFPPVYNEDWLFLHDFVKRGQVGIAGAVTQLPYDPFLPNRARAEEFGDVLAEGLFSLIHARRSVSVAQFPSYWDGVLLERHRLLEGVLRRLGHLAGHSRDARPHEKELLAVEASQEQLARITAQSLAEFVGAWRYDLYRWNARLHLLPRFSRITDALNWLGITDIHGA